MEQALLAGALFLTNVEQRFPPVAARVAVVRIQAGALATAKEWILDSWSRFDLALAALNKDATPLSPEAAAVLFETWAMAWNNNIPGARTSHPLGFAQAQKPRFVALARSCLQEQQTSRGCASGMLACGDLPFLLRFTDTLADRTGELTWFAGTSHVSE